MQKKHCHGGGILRENRVTDASKTAAAAAAITDHNTSSDTSTNATSHTRLTGCTQNEAYEKKRSLYITYKAIVCKIGSARRAAAPASSREMKRKWRGKWEDAEKITGEKLSTIGRTLSRERRRRRTTRRESFFSGI